MCECKVAVWCVCDGVKVEAGVCVSVHMSYLCFEHPSMRYVCGCECVME